MKIGCSNCRANCVDFDITALFPSARRLRALVRGVPGVDALLVGHVSIQICSAPTASPARTALPAAHFSRNESHVIYGDRTLVARFGAERTLPMPPFVFG
jgi:hypothetical protein